MPNEKTLILVKPDGVQRGLIGDVIGRLEKTGLKIIGIKFIQISEELAGKHYAEHKDKPFFNDLVDYMTSESVVVQVLEGENCIEKYRTVMGSTNPENADIGTIRQKHALNVQENSVHGSDSKENAMNEIKFFFNEDEIVG